MLSDEVIAVYEDVGRRMAKQAAALSAANRMSNALDAVRTKMGAIGKPGSAGRIPGAPSMHPPSVQGVSMPRAEKTPNLGFPSVPKPPTRV